MTGIVLEANALTLDSGALAGRSQAEIAFDQIKDAIIRCELNPGLPSLRRSLRSGFKPGVPRSVLL